jgi:SAM-dependent methyltransferase
VKRTKENEITFPIISTWPNYFHTLDEGIGTTYERFIINRYFESIRDRFYVRSLLEVPSFGMTGVSGINSMWWALNGVQVTIVDDSAERIALVKSVWEDMALHAEFLLMKECEKFPYENKMFDMSWNFASLWFVTDLDVFLKELTRITREVIFLCVPNRNGLGYMVRNFVGGGLPQGIQEAHINSDTIKTIMKKNAWEVNEEGYFDIPPWPDIAMKKEDLLQKIGLGWLAHRLFPPKRNGLCILDFYSGKEARMQEDILKFDFLERSPRFFQKYWAHHWYAVFTPQKEPK